MKKINNQKNFHPLSIVRGSSGLCYTVASNKGEKVNGAYFLLTVHLQIL